MPKSAAQRSKERRDRKKRGERMERVILKPGQAVLILDVGEMADRLGVPDWDAENPNVVLPLVGEHLRRLRRKRHG